MTALRQLGAVLRRWLGHPCPDRVTVDAHARRMAALAGRREVGR